MPVNIVSYKFILLSSLIWIIFSTVYSTSSFSQPLPLDPITAEESDIVIDKIENNKTNLPVFTFHSKNFEICLKNNICAPGNYKDYIPITTLTVFKGCTKSRIDKKSIMWELKFLEFAPSVITYSQVPYNARQVVKAKALKSGNTYTVCVYPKNSRVNCSKWVFATDK